ncbi:MAG: TOBE domain-containing protein, partial [Bryobacteraceae bacterium]
EIDNEDARPLLTQAKNGEVDEIDDQSIFGKGITIAHDRNDVDAPGQRRFGPVAVAMNDERGHGRPVRAVGDKRAGLETEGVIDEVIYFGDMTYYEVYLGGTDVEVRLSMRNVPGRPVLDVGEKVRVAWSPSALVLFR